MKKKQESDLTLSVPGIIIKNTFTLFNLVLIFLAVIIVLVARPANVIGNVLFLGVAIANTFMGCFQEIRAKHSLDKLAVLAKTQVVIVRDGEELTVSQDDLKVGDTMVMAAGNQACADGVVVSSERLEMDESLLTGESDRIQKKDGDGVLSGSYVTSGHAHVRVTAVGEDSYAQTLTNQAKGMKKHPPRLLRTLNQIILVLTCIMVPLGLALFFVDFHVRDGGLESAVMGSATAVLGMIPSGLILLTGVTMAVGAMKLARRKALVQALPSIETLARTDVLCLDKTGTITDGSLRFEQMILFGDKSEDGVGIIISELMGALEDSNSTAKALTNIFGKLHHFTMDSSVPFSSDRKWSGATFISEGSYILGAPNIIFGDQEGAFLDQANELASQGNRVLALAGSPSPIENDILPADLSCLALLVLSDNIRENAAETFRYFAGEEVIIKVISGDNPRTVSAVAAKAGLAGADRSIDMRLVEEDADYAAISEEYTVFGHVTPQQKRDLIRGLKKNGHTACMTGDGVNDILAMRESDCSVAMVGGSDAARSACDFVLMSDDFSAMIDVLREGRRVINNIERVAAIFLLKTTYSILLTILYIIIPYPYPISPAQMTPINALTVGIPSFFLALQANYVRPKGKLLLNLLEHTVPAAITVVFNTVYLQVAGILFEVPDAEISSMIVFLIGIMGFYLLFQLAKPMTKRIRGMFIGLIVTFVLSFYLLGDIFNMTSMFSRNAFFYLPLVYFSYHVHSFLGKWCRKTVEAYRILRAAGWTKRKAE